MTKTVRKDRFYAHPREAVWAALTDPRALAEWLMPNTFRPEVGAHFQFGTDPAPMCGDGRTDCRVEVLDPPSRMVWSWACHARGGRVLTPMTVEWTLADEPGGTRLTLTHSGLEHIPVLWRFMMNAGWGMMMKRLIPKVLARTERGHHGWVFRPGAIPLGKRCYKTRSLPEEFVR